MTPQHDMEQFAAILTRYPIYEPKDDAEEWDIEFYNSRLKYESRLLGRRNPLKRDRGVEYFTENDMKPGVRPVRKKATFVKIQNVDLCIHHATGKKPAFADFVRSFAKELLAAVNKLLNEFPCGDFYRWVKENLDPYYVDIMYVHNRTTDVAFAITDILSGNKVFLDDVIVVHTICTACQVCASISNPAFVKSLIFIAGYLGSDKLKAYVEASSKQVAAIRGTAIAESAKATYVKLKAAYNLYQGPMGDSLRSFEQVVAPQPAPIIPPAQPTITTAPHPTTTTTLDTSDPAPSNSPATQLLRQNPATQQSTSSATAALSIPRSMGSVITSSPQSIPSSSGASIRSWRRSLDHVKRSYLTLFAERRHGKEKAINAVAVSA